MFKLFLKNTNKEEAWIFNQMELNNQNIRQKGSCFLGVIWSFYFIRVKQLNKTRLKIILMSKIRK